MKYLYALLSITLVYLVLYIPVRLSYDNGYPANGIVFGNFPGLSFWHGGQFDAVLFYLYYPLIVIDGRITGINYLYSGNSFQIIQWNKK